MIKLIKKKFSKLYTKNVKQRFEILRQIYINRKSAIIEKEKKLNPALFICGTGADVVEYARYWQREESREKYLTNALLEWEYMITLNQAERELLKKGAELRQKFFEECVLYKNQTLD